MKQEIFEINGFHRFLSKCNDLIKEGYFIDSILERYLDYSNESAYVIITHKIITE